MPKKLIAGKGIQHLSLIPHVGKLTNDLTSKGFIPILVGGMALVVLGSKRVTQDFDFLVAETVRAEKSLMEVFYSQGFELISRLNEEGDVVRTVDNSNVAWARLQIDKPKSALFYNDELDLRVDVLFDFPIPAAEVLARSRSKKLRSYVFHIASNKDLIKMKQIAAKDRKFAGDTQDLEFLKSI